MFSKILIANRGEIAVRIIRACKEMGVSTVAVYSTADKEALHVSLADESVCIGPGPVAESYLNMNAILSAAIYTGADAVHPGYGLLSENDRFAELCEVRYYLCGSVGGHHPPHGQQGGGPPHHEGRRRAGYPRLRRGAHTGRGKAGGGKKIGFPLLCKARSGGGGRGIRLVHSMEELEGAFTTASKEAVAAFGDGGIYLEKYLTHTKHIEMQVLCDLYGGAVCLGERDCSMQRKNQKLIEESPSAAVDEITRAAMVDASLKAVEAVGYQNAGTIEYLMADDGQFYFMEMNTRLQVEHPVTEMVTGIDLVKWQIRVAAGAQLPFEQRDITLRGHAIECRINAENPYQGFRPSCGEISPAACPGRPLGPF